MLSVIFTPITAFVFLHVADVPHSAVLADVPHSAVRAEETERALLERRRGEARCEGCGALVNALTRSWNSGLSSIKLRRLIVFVAIETPLSSF